MARELLLVLVQLNAPSHGCTHPFDFELLSIEVFPLNVIFVVKVKAWLLVIKDIYDLAIASLFDSVHFGFQVHLIGFSDRLLFKGCLWNVVNGLWNLRAWNRLVLSIDYLVLRRNWHLMLFQHLLVNVAVFVFLHGIDLPC